MREEGGKVSEKGKKGSPVYDDILLATRPQGKKRGQR